VAVFAVNGTTGSLEFTGQYTPVGNPSCVTFVDLAKVK
jgi:6-phosphogluconolactonase